MLTVVLAGILVWSSHATSVRPVRAVQGSDTISSISGSSSDDSKTLIYEFDDRLQSSFSSNDPTVPYNELTKKNLETHGDSLATVRDDESYESGREFPLYNTRLTMSTMSDLDPMEYSPEMVRQYERVHEEEVVPEVRENLPGYMRRLYTWLTRRTD